MRAAIYAANLRHGGGASGASTFLDDLPRLAEDGYLEGFEHLEVVASTFVVDNMVRAVEISGLPNVSFVVRDDFPHLKSVFRRSAPERPDYDVEFVVRGPHYAPLRARRTILGFADGSIFFPAPRLRGESRVRRLRGKALNVVKRRLMHQYDAFVVQTPRLGAKVLSTVSGLPVHVIPNSPSQLFTNPELWRSTTIPEARPGSLRLFYPARGYPHKNHSIIGPVGEILEHDHGVRLDVVVTLRDAEFSDLDSVTRRYCTNAGEVGLDQCPPLYQATEGVFFPSLNETFSVTPLEAMIMRRPVVASDRDFVRETAGETPFYFEPLDPKAAAEAISDAFLSGLDNRRRLAAGVEFVNNLPTPYRRSKEYMRVLRNTGSFSDGL